MKIPTEPRRNHYTFVYLKIYYASIKQQDGNV